MSENTITIESLMKEIHDLQKIVVEHMKDPATIDFKQLEATFAERVEDELFVRSPRGDSDGWFRDAEQRHEGRIEADSSAVDVAFEDAPHHLDEEIDAAYRTKYGSSSPVAGVTTDVARATTIRVVPR